MLKLYSNKLFSDTVRYPVILAPFWGKFPEDPLRPSTGRFDAYLRTGQSMFSLAPLEEADLAVLPAGWGDLLHNRAAQKLAREFASHVAAAGKPLVIFFPHDSFEKLPLKDAIVFRTSFYRSRRTSREFAIPVWSEDIVEKYLGGQLVVRKKGPQPIVGFVGWTGHLGPRDPRASTRLPRWSRLKWPAKWIGHLLGFERFDRTRALALEALRQSEHVQTNFVYRDIFLGSSMMGSGRYIKEKGRINSIRREFVDNIIASDYVLCCRGAGNYSYRLYETLCSGRIPIFVDTDAPLPYDFAVDWRQYCIWVNQPDIRHIGEIVADFHSRISPNEFEELQLACRKFWLEMISPQGFFSNFYRHFQLPGLKPIDTDARRAPTRSSLVDPAVEV